MNWIKEHRFLSGLVAVTLLLVAALAWLGLRGAERYEQAKEVFEDAFGEAERLERLPLYPAPDHLDAKEEALQAYRKETGTLQDAFAPYRTGDLPNMSPEAFAEKLKAAVDETTAAFAGKTELPEGYFMGFEKYRAGAIVQEKATGVLGYHLDAVKQMMLGMASSGVSKLVNLHRPLLDEEEGRIFEAEKTQVARGLSLELTFQGNEKSVRQFLTSLVNTKERYLVVRSLAVQNTNAEAPNTQDAQFERSTVRNTRSGAASAAPAAGAFEAFFANQNQEGSEEVIAPTSAPVNVDTSRFLSQVLGQEELVVFLRLDVLQFLPSKDLP